MSTWDEVAACLVRDAGAFELPWREAGVPNHLTRGAGTPYPGLRGAPPYSCKGERRALHEHL